MDDEPDIEAMFLIRVRGKDVSRKPLDGTVLRWLALALVESDGDVDRAVRSVKAHIRRQLSRASP